MKRTMASPCIYWPYSAVAASLRLAMLIAAYFQLPHPLHSTHISGYCVIGGLLFGAGAVFNNGCGVSTISKLARGQIAMLATITGWLISWISFTSVMPHIPHQPFHMPSQIHITSLILLWVAILIGMTRLPPPQQKLWASMLAIGLMASIIFLYEPQWTPSGLLKGRQP